MVKEADLKEQKDKQWEDGRERRVGLWRSFQTGGKGVYVSKSYIAHRTSYMYSYVRRFSMHVHCEVLFCVGAVYRITYIFLSRALFHRHLHMPHTYIYTYNYTCTVYTYNLPINTGHGTRSGAQDKEGQKVKEERKKEEAPTRNRAAHAEDCQKGQR